MEINYKLLAVNPTEGCQVKLLLDYGTILAFVMFSAGSISQIAKILKRQSAADIAISDIVLRLLASIILFIKIISVGDRYLIIGQSISFLIFFFYCTIAIKHRHGPEVKT